jgi:hypothetical protein
MMQVQKEPKARKLRKVKTQRLPTRLGSNKKSVQRKKKKLPNSNARKRNASARSKRKRRLSLMLLRKSPALRSKSSKTRSTL